MNESVDCASILYDKYLDSFSKHKVEKDTFEVESPGHCYMNIYKMKKLREALKEVKSQEIRTDFLLKEEATLIRDFR